MATHVYLVSEKEDLPDGKVKLSLQCPGRKAFNHNATCKITKPGSTLQLRVEDSSLPNAIGDVLFFNTENLRATYGSPNDIR